MNNWWAEEIVNCELLDVHRKKFTVYNTSLRISKTRRVGILVENRQILHSKCRRHGIVVD